MKLNVGLTQFCASPVLYDKERGYENEKRFD